MLPSEEAFAAGCSALGIENKGGVVVYGGELWLSLFILLLCSVFLRYWYNSYVGFILLL